MEKRCVLIEDHVDITLKNAVNQPEEWLFGESLKQYVHTQWKAHFAAWIKEVLRYVGTKSLLSGKYGTTWN